MGKRAPSEDLVDAGREPSGSARMIWPGCWGSHARPCGANLVDLEEIGKVARVHGGAVLPETRSEDPFRQRMASQVRAKTEIAKKAISLIQPGHTIMVDAGSTTAVLARELVKVPGVSVITNSLDVATTLQAGGPGGRLAGRSGLPLMCPPTVRRTHAVGNPPLRGRSLLLRTRGPSPGKRVVLLRPARGRNSNCHGRAGGANSGSRPSHQTGCHQPCPIMGCGRDRNPGHQSGRPPCAARPVSKCRYRSCLSSSHGILTSGSVGAEATMKRRRCRSFCKTRPRQDASRRRKKWIEIVLYARGNY